jgi:hypothetical protein
VTKITQVSEETHLGNHIVIAVHAGFASLGRDSAVSKGQVVTMNRAAERLLAEGGDLQARREGLMAERAEESARLKQLVAEATAASARAGLEPAGVLTVSRRNHSPLQLLVSPVRGFDLDERHPVRAIVFAGDSAQRVGPTPGGVHGPVVDRVPALSPFSFRSSSCAWGKATCGHESLTNIESTPRSGCSATALPPVLFRKGGPRSPAHD